jgi:hypothetical protein
MVTMEFQPLGIVNPLCRLTKGLAEAALESLVIGWI